MSDSIRQDGQDVLVFVRAKPRAGQSRVVGERESELEVALKAPPVDGAANEELIRFVAKSLGLPKNCVTLERGQTSRHKVLRLSAVSVAVIRAQLLK